MSVRGHLHIKYNCPWKPEEGVGFPAARVGGGCALADLGCAAANSSSLLKQQALLMLSRLSSFCCGLRLTWFGLIWFG